MRKLVPVLFGLGGFLLVAGLVAAIWAPGMVKKTPLDVNSTTLLSGQAQKLNVATGELESNPVKASSITKSDSKISDGKVVAFANSSCLVIDRDDPGQCVDDKDPRLVSASTDVFATDRTTALAVNTSKYLPSDATKHEGLQNKWPFDAEKKTYPYWDGTAGEAVDAVFDREQDRDGLTTYVYRVSVDQAPIEISDGVPGTYSDEKELYVDPVTGSIIQQVDRQSRVDDEGNPFLAVDLSFTDDQVTKNVETAKSNGRSLDLVSSTLPLIGFAVGIPLLLIGLALLLLTQRSGRHAGAS